MHIELLKKLLKERPETSKVFKRNLVKEYFQILLLSYIYSHNKYQNMIFYGGSCLRHCYELERLSEDLHFVDLSKTVDMNELSKDVQSFLNRELEAKIISKVQKFRIYLKIPILASIDLAEPGESDILFIKIEVYKKFEPHADYNVQIIPLFKSGRSFLVRTFDLPTLMATKISAILARKWEKAEKGGRTVCYVKGRDYFDLMWYLNKGVVPNIKLIDIDTMDELKTKLSSAIAKADGNSIKLDLEGFISDENFVKQLSKNMKAILIGQVKLL